MEKQKIPDGQNQTRVFIVGFILIFVVVVWTFARPMISKFGSQSDSEEEINKEIMKAPLVTPEELFKKISEGKNEIAIFDLRNKDDFSRGHIKASTNVPPGTELVEAVSGSRIGKTSDIIITNQGDDVYEVARKVNELAQKGFVNAAYLQGGINAWKNRGYLLISSGGGETDASKIKKISVDQSLKEKNANPDSIQFLDVRDAQLFAKGRIAGAVNVPMSEIEKNQGKISPVKKVIVYGADESEATKAAIMLFDLDFFNIYVLEGGFAGWQMAGGKVENN